MISNELLDDLIAGILQLFERLGHDLLDLLQEVHPNVLVAVRLEDVASNLTTFEALRMNEVAKLTTSASVRAVIVTTRDRAEVAWLDDLIHVDDGLLRRRNLIDLGHLGLPLFIGLLELRDGFVGKFDQYIRRLALSLHQ